LQLRAPRFVRHNRFAVTVPLTMPDTPRTGGVHVDSSAGHLSVHIEGEHPVEIPFLLERQAKRIGPALGFAMVYHVVAAFLLILAVRYGGGTSATTAAILPEQPDPRIVWLSQPGPGGGGGGGGNQMKEPPRKAELPGKDKLTVPVTKPPAIEAPRQAKVEPNPIELLNIPAKSLADATESLPGAIEAPPSLPAPTASQGSGSGGGAGTGRGSGVGPGTGSGLGPGSGGGTGGGVYQLGSGVTTPVPIFQPTPQYTSDAMRARVQGIAVVSCVVRPDGTVTDVDVVRSLDSSFGLDEEAIKAAKRWRFKPGTLRGEAVSVRVVIEMSFTLR
jgi:periplasmic protein TonB